MSDMTDKAAEENRRAWNSFRRQLDKGRVNIRPDSAAAILAGRRFLYPENLPELMNKANTTSGYGAAH